MQEIKLPKTIKVGGFDYKIICSGERDAELDRRNLWGEASHGKEREIVLTSTLSPQNLTNTIIHELIHVSDGVNNCTSRLTEAQVEGIANGLHQIFEELGVRFVVPK